MDSISFIELWQSYYTGHEWPTYFPNALLYQDIKCINVNDCLQQFLMFNIMLILTTYLYAIQRMGLLLFLWQSYSWYCFSFIFESHGEMCGSLLSNEKMIKKLGSFFWLTLSSHLHLYMWKEGWTPGGGRPGETERVTGWASRTGSFTKI